jgi:hypothetical protein
MQEGSDGLVFLVRLPRPHAEHGAPIFAVTVTRSFVVIVQVKSKVFLISVYRRKDQAAKRLRDSPDTVATARMKSSAKE